MSLERTHGLIVFTCDVCHDAALETGETDFGEAKAMLDAEGWKARSVSGDWQHHCPFCAS